MLWIILGLLGLIVAAVLIWFNIPYSPLKSDFQRQVEQNLERNLLSQTGSIDAADYAYLPTALQKYLKNNGYLGTPNSSYFMAEFKNVPFKSGKNQPDLTVDYRQYNFVNQPVRLALIESSMFGIPFEGVDSLVAGKGGMKGVLAKLFVLFDQRGQAMDKAALATYLSEILFLPAAWLTASIRFEELDDFQVGATLEHQERRVYGIFRFNEAYELLTFTTEDRAYIANDGSTQYIPWSARCEEYQPGENGINLPTKYQAIWHFPEGDLIYFDGTFDTFTLGN